MFRVLASYLLNYLIVFRDRNTIQMYINKSETTKVCI